MTQIKSPKQIKLMEEAGRILALALKKISAAVRPGVSTKELNSLANDICRQYKVKPAFLGYNAYPASICTSLNNEVVHGIPNDKPLKNGDILGIDMGVVYLGYCADSAVTVGIGEISSEAKKLITVTKKSLDAAIAIIKDGVRVGDIGYEISKIAAENHLGVIKELTGHGIGTNLQEDPSIPNYGNRGTGVKLVEGMTVAIEPMLTLGGAKINISTDGWTVKTADGSLSAHFEHTILVKKNTCQVLTSVDK